MSYTKQEAEKVEELLTEYKTSRFRFSHGLFLERRLNSSIEKGETSIVEVVCEYLRETKEIDCSDVSNDDVLMIYTLIIKNTLESSANEVDIKTGISLENYLHEKFLIKERILQDYIK